MDTAAQRCSPNLSSHHHRPPRLPGSSQSRPPVFAPPPPSTIIWLEPVVCLAGVVDMVDPLPREKIRRAWVLLCARALTDGRSRHAFCCRPLASSGLATCLHDIKARRQCGCPMPRVPPRRRPGAPMSTRARSIRGPIQPPNWLDWGCCHGGLSSGPTERAWARPSREPQLEDGPYQLGLRCYESGDRSLATAGPAASTHAACRREILTTPHHRPTTPSPAQGGGPTDGGVRVQQRRHSSRRLGLGSGIP